MPRYYCDYCDTYLTHDSPSVRKQHNAGYKHKANVRTYYQQFEEQQTQSLIDQRIKEHLGQAAAFQQVGAAFNQHLMAQRPRLPVMPIPGAGQLPVNQPMVPGMRPPVLPRPVPGAPGYAPIPGMPPMMAPPGAPYLGQVNALPRPPTLAPPTTVAGTATTPTSSNGTPTTSSTPYQATEETFKHHLSIGSNYPRPDIIEWLQEEGFYHGTFIRGYKLIPSLITALIERWRSETHMFHMSCEECIVTLEDVVMLIGMPVNGSPLVKEPEESCAQLYSDYLNKVSAGTDVRGSHIKLSC